MLESNTFVPVSILHGKTFLVEDYQRGYKWGKAEVDALLNDINDHVTDKGAYCLQPIIVKPLDANKFEVIDGQQRLTSLFLLFHYLGASDIQYAIEYKTRESSKQFLADKKNLQSLLGYTSWSHYLQANPAFDNVDVYHFYEVYKSINEWFWGQEIEKGFFFEKINKILHIIWYDVTKGVLQKKEDIRAEDIFINFNANKVGLSNAELIKALFILDHDGQKTKEQKRHQAVELALEWDAIENRLQDDAFWYFICNDTKYKNAETRIDYLFDIRTKSITSKDAMASYHFYERLIVTDEVKEAEWRKVKNLYYKLEEWFQDKFLYHYVGYLIATGLADILGIVGSSNGKTKDQFRINLEELIKREFREKDNEVFVYDLNILDFESKKKACSNLLLWLNVKYYLKGSGLNRFPFDLFYKYNWSIEHINPQNPRAFESIAQLEEWLKSIETFFDESNKEIIARLKQGLDTSSLDVLLKDEHFMRDLEAATSSVDVHNIANLALLDRNTNSALGNKTFLKKREIVLQYDLSGCNDAGEPVFIPPCTRDLFTKTYSYLQPDRPQTYFSVEDMQEYRNYIESVLQELSQPSTESNGKE